VQLNKKKKIETNIIEKEEEIHLYAIEYRYFDSLFNLQK